MVNSLCSLRNMLVTLFSRVRKNTFHVLSVPHRFTLCRDGIDRGTFPPLDASRSAVQEFLLYEAQLRDGLGDVLVQGERLRRKKRLILRNNPCPFLSVYCLCDTKTCGCFSPDGLTGSHARVLG